MNLDYLLLILMIMSLFLCLLLPFGTFVALVNCISWIISKLNYSALGSVLDFSAL